MAETKEFWVPNELALEILGFNKNILEKRINADYIKREIRGGIELLEISGEIERFGLSLTVAQEKVDAYINKNGVEPKTPELERPRSKTTIIGPPISAPDAGIPVQPVVLPPQTPTPVAMAPVKVIDHTQQLNKISQVLDDIRKLTVAMPESILIKAPKESNLPNPQIAEIKLGLSKLANLTEQNKEYQNQIITLQAQLKTSNAEITKLTTQSNAVMDEMERATQKHNKDLEGLKSTLKSEIGQVNSILTNKLRKPKNAITIILLLIIAGGLGFLIYELIKPTYSVLVQPNDKINPISKKDVSDSIKQIIDPMEEKLTTKMAQLNSQNNERHQKELVEINAIITSSLEGQKEIIKKTIDSIVQNQKEAKTTLDENYTKSLKTLETHISDLEKQLKKLMETTVQIKPGTKFIPDSNE